MAIYGIDLGTTNSLLGLGDKLLTGLVPSIVDFEDGTAGEFNKDKLNAERSFKVDMSSGNEGIVARKASSVVLKQLKKDAGLTGRIKAVITVPAEFDDNQRKATLTAAEMADIEVIALVNEPTAAALYITQNKRDVTVVFDLGGGTFDVSVIDSRYGNYDVQASAGDPRCGGDNLDVEIMKLLMQKAKIAPYRVNKEQRLQLKLLACSVKIKMQKEQKAFSVDLTEYGGTSVKFTPDEYEALMKHCFMKCIVLLHNVIRGSLEVGESYHLALVGGSTRCPFLRRWIAREIGQEPLELTYDPDKAVAYGAAFYAKMCEDGEIDYMVSDVTKQLGIGLVEGTMRVIIPENSKIPIEEEVMLTNPVDTEALEVSLYQGNSVVTANNSYIGTLLYKYGEKKPAQTGVVFATVRVERSGVVTLTCSEPLKEPVEVKLEVK